MENKEFSFQGKVFSGLGMLFVNILMGIAALAIGIYGIVLLDNGADFGGWLLGGGILLLLLSIFVLAGFIKVEPNEALVMMFFGQYKGTFTKVGFHWVNPLIYTKKLSFRARNIDAEPIKVNDKTGNPVMIGMMLVWKLKDTYKAIFEIDSETMAQGNVATDGTQKPGDLMSAFERFVRVQGDAALRQVAGQYAYDNIEDDNDSQTLRDNSDEINKLLEATLDERLDMAGIEIVEARINYLAYAPEIAAVMLRRQQASAIISAREKIVDGAVSMVDLALKRLSEDNIVDLDEDKKAAMVSNLMVVLCSENNTQAVVNTGTLNM
ncbi:SPFH domain-containing protein [Prevotella sp. HUN102]|uniref:SPFH domain-containing protein n=1 Tax=Prevotella sp. HUN102 TaxID=1392486 RepID=UPI0004904FDE|nr:SPFH domain-containing protein [Prevotella sp. HUN102]